jgi:hypothetical protein
MLRIVVILLLFCFGCQTGRIPCPKFKATKSGHHKRYKNYSASLTAKADQKDPEIKMKKAPETRYVQNISVEEWDCPQPGAKKYLPRNIKENIRKNTRRIREDVGKVSVDSTAVE